MTTRRASAATGILVALFAGAGSPRAEVESLTLYQKAARAPLVVRARALSDSTRKPRVEVLEIFKGSYPSGTLTVVPHFEDNSSPTPWLRREIFRSGEESILFLTPYADEFGRDGGSDTFSLLNADQGKLEVPTEGGDALLSALRRFVEILSLRQHDLQALALRELLRAQNPYLIEAALSECRKFRLAEAEDTELLLRLTESRRVDFRAGALALIGQILTDARFAGRPELPSRQAAFERVAGSARLDSEDSVRREAVAALEAFGDAPALSIIESVGREDASQSVRYQAQVAAYRLREKLH